MLALQGTLDAIGLEDLLQILLRNRQTGLLTVRRARLNRTLHVSPAGLRLRGATGRPATADERRERARETVLDLFHWPRASFEFREGPAPVEPSSPLFTPSDITHLLLEAARRSEEMASFRKSFPRLDMIPAWTLKWRPNPALAAQAADLTAVAKFVDGRRSVEAILSDSPLSMFRTLRVLHLLQWSGFLTQALPPERPEPIESPEDDDAKVALKRAIGGTTFVVVTDPPMTRAILRVRGPALAPAAALHALRGSDLKLAPDIEQRLQHGDPKNLVVAEGVPATRGRDGQVRWAVDWECEKAQVRFVADQADFYEVHSIVQVAPGELIGEILPPEPGVDGVDVFGRPIQAPHGHPATMRPGINVELDGSRILSRTFGRVRHDETRVWVDPLFWVNGDLDFHTGNIRFAGDVVVTGNVLDGFEIDAAGSITVHGSVFASTLRAGRDIVIREGANGHGKGRLHAGGLVTATYLNAVEVRAGGDVKILNEILNSSVCAGGRVKIPEGAIVGGTVVGRRGIEASVVGSPMRVPTKVVAGIDPATEQLVRELTRRVQDASDRMLRIYHMIRPFVDQPESIDALPESRREVARDQLEDLRRLSGERADAERKLNELYAWNVDERDLRVRLLHHVYGKVTITIGRMSTTYEVELAGPITMDGGGTRRLYAV